MKKSTKGLLCALAVGEVALILVVYNALIDTVSPLALWAIIGGILGLSLLCDWLLMRKDNAPTASEVKKLKDSEDYIAAFEAWHRQGTPFQDYLTHAIRQLETLQNKQNALRTILEDSKDSPFFSVANDVDTYILANDKRILNRILVYDAGGSQRLEQHRAYLHEVLRDNDKVLNDFENLILEVSQIGDDATAATPCLTELTNALRSVRTNFPEEGEQQQIIP